MLLHPIAELNSKTIKHSFPVSYWRHPFSADILLSLDRTALLPLKTQFALDNPTLSQSGYDCGYI
jgi:hypothetical protein